METAPNDAPSLANYHEPTAVTKPNQHDGPEIVFDQDAVQVSLSGGTA
jgi:hypothetical protein